LAAKEIYGSLITETFGN